MIKRFFGALKNIFLTFFKNKPQEDYLKFNFKKEKFEKYFVKCRKSSAKFLTFISPPLSENGWPPKTSEGQVNAEKRLIFRQWPSSCSKSEGGPGRHHTRPGQLKERLGGGHKIADRRRLRRRLQRLAGALQKVLPPRRWLRREIF